MNGYEMEATEFWAPSVSQAMKQIALELGENAMILSTEEQPHPLNPSQKVFCVVAAQPGLLPEVESTPMPTLAGTETPSKPAGISPEQMQIFHALLGQLREVKAELSDLRAAQTEWEKTTLLCRELRREVRTLAGRVMGEAGVNRADLRTPEPAASLEGEQTSTAAIPVIAPLWEEQSPGVVFFGGSQASEKSQAVARIALACEHSGQSVAMIDLTDTGELEALGKQVGVPAWNVPREGNLPHILRACSSLDLILIDGLDEMECEVQDASKGAGLQYRSLRVIGADEPTSEVRKQLELAAENASIVVTRLESCENMNGLLAELRISGYPVSHVCEGSDLSGGVRAARTDEMKLDTRAA